MRLAAVRERDPDLDRLLRLAAVMSGGFTREAMLRVWATLAQEPAALDGAITRGTKMGFLKFLTASGNTAAGTGGRRRSSAASGAAGRFVFSHLKILDNVMDLLLRDDARQLHVACAKSLEGVVDTVQLAQHSEQARSAARAAVARVPRAPRVGADAWSTPPH